MSLNDAQVARLCETFRNRAEDFRRKAKETNIERDMLTFAAFASTLEWAVRELRFTAGITVTADATATNTAEYGPRTYDKAVISLEDILLRGLKSIRSEHFKRKEFANRLGLSVQTLVNIERGHRKLRAGELFLLSFAMDKSPEWIVQELMRRFEPEISQWRKDSGG